MTQLSVDLSPNHEVSVDLSPKPEVSVDYIKNLLNFISKPGHEIRLSQRIVSSMYL
jgi:hypothetical protein